MAEIRHSRNVELCFLVDCTGSMGPDIDGVRSSIKQIVTWLTETSSHVRLEEAPVKEMKLAFVGYRDHGTTPQFEILNFTGLIPNFERFCQNIRTIANTDKPEDVFGGLEKALELGWSANAGTKVIFHICDAPCHGNDFHVAMRDNYPDGDPLGRTHTGLFSRLRSSRIQYYFGKITSYTDIMLKKFSDVYGEEITDFDKSMWRSSWKP